MGRLVQKAFVLPALSSGCVVGSSSRGCGGEGRQTAGWTLSVQLSGKMLGQCFSSSSSWLQTWKPLKRSQRACSPAARRRGKSVAKLRAVRCIAFFCFLRSQFRGRLAARFCFSKPRTPAVRKCPFPKMKLGCWASSGFPQQAASLLPTTCPHASFFTFLSFLVVSTVGSGLLEQRFRSHCDSVFDFGCSGSAKCSVANAKVRVRRRHFSHHFSFEFRENAVPNSGPFSGPDFGAACNPKYVVLQVGLRRIS